MRTSLERNDLPRILRSSAGRRGGGIAWWETGRDWVPVLGPGIEDAREAGDALEVGTDVPLAEWASLAHGSVTALGPAHIRTDPSVAVAVDVTDDRDDDHDPAGPDESGYGPGAYFAHAMNKDD